MSDEKINRSPWDFTTPKGHAEAKTQPPFYGNMSSATYASQAEVTAQREILERLMTVSEALTERSEATVSRTDDHEDRFDGLESEVRTVYDNQKEIEVRLTLAVAAAGLALILAVIALIVALVV